MKLPVLLSLAVSTLFACSSESSSTSATKDFTKKEKFVFITYIPMEADLAARMSLIAPPDVTVQLASLAGTSDPYTFGLAYYDNFIKYNEHFHIEAKNVLRLSVGDALSDFQADLIDHSSGRAVGSVSFEWEEDFPKRPLQVLELCTGAYEKVCTLGFDEDTRRYSLSFYPSTEVETLQRSER